jgi:hypothetical protein
VFYKKPIHVEPNPIQPLQQKSYLSEIEEESDLNVNNGLPPIKSFEMITKHQAECIELFLLFQVQIKPGEAVDKYRVDLLVSQTSLLFNRSLLARCQTFLHQATLHRALNAAAEAEYDEKV